MLTTFLLTPVLFSIVHILLLAVFEPRNRTNIWDQPKNVIWRCEEEKIAISEFKALGTDVIPEDELYAMDYFILRWLKARDLNAIAAYRMAREAHQWRIRNNIESILNEAIMTFPTNPYQISGHDKEGRPLLVFTPKHMDLNKIMLTGKGHDALRFFDQMLERGYHVAKNSKHLLISGKPVTSFVAIVDMGGLTFRQHLCLKCFPFYLKCAQHFENYYPGITNKIIVININRFALPIVELILPILSTSTRNSLKYFGTNRTEWSLYLSSIISPDQLSRQYMN